MPMSGTRVASCERVAGENDCEYVAIDVETTGLFASADRVIEFGAVRFDGSGKVRGRFQQLVNPQQPISPGARAVHGLTDADLAGAPLAVEVLPAFLAFLGHPASTRLLAHNASFDAGFVGREVARAGLPMPGHTLYDTLTLARASLPKSSNHKLETLAVLLQLDTTGAHRALGDSLRVMGVWLALEGHRKPVGSLAAYKIADPLAPAVAPADYAILSRAIAQRSRVRIEYAGGRRGTAPREITPLRISGFGKKACVVAVCHVDRIEKTFRLDRVRRLEIVEIEPGTCAGGQATS